MPHQFSNSFSDTVVCAVASYCNLAFNVSQSDCIRPCTSTHLTLPFFFFLHKHSTAQHYTRYTATARERPQSQSRTHPKKKVCRKAIFVQSCVHTLHILGPSSLTTMAAGGGGKGGVEVEVRWRCRRVQQQQQQHNCGFFLGEGGGCGDSGA